MNIDFWLVFDLLDEPLLFTDLEEAQECAKDFADTWQESITLFKVQAAAVYKPRKLK